MFSVVLHLDLASINTGIRRSSLHLQRLHRSNCSDINMCVSQKVCFVTQHSVKSREDIPGKRKSFYEGLTGQEKVLNPSVPALLL